MPMQASLGAHERMTSNRRVARLCRRVRELWKQRWAAVQLGFPSVFRPFSASFAAFRPVFQGVRRDFSMAFGRSSAREARQVRQTEQMLYQKALDALQELTAANAKRRTSDVFAMTFHGFFPSFSPPFAVHLGYWLLFVYLKLLSRVAQAGGDWHVLE